MNRIFEINDLAISPQWLIAHVERVSSASGDDLIRLNDRWFVASECEFVATSNGN